jgi:WD40 repeat protein
MDSRTVWAVVIKSSGMQSGFAPSLPPASAPLTVLPRFLAIYSSQELKGHGGQIFKVSWDPSNADRLASTSSDKTIKVWDTRTNKVTHSLECKSEFQSVNWSADGVYLVASNSAVVHKDTHHPNSHTTQIQFDIISKYFFVCWVDIDIVFKISKISRKNP